MTLYATLLLRVVFLVWGAFGVAAGLVSAFREVGSPYGGWIKAVGWLWIAVSGAVLVFWAVVP